MAGVGDTTVNISIDANAKRKLISPNIYGRNNNLSDSKTSPTKSANWQLYKEAGLRFFRENGGNNSTKYNWKSKLSSHPDWYNNVYGHDWDYAANSLQQNMPNAKGMWAFQLIGKVASNTKNNFKDWEYNQANGYINQDKNWAGGGGPSAYGGNNGVGNPTLYLKDWPADSTTAILDNWFGTNLNLNKSQFDYWNMDNEPEAWLGTHDDLIDTSLSAEGYMQKYFAVAKKARQKFSTIKLVGPVFTNEWQWFNWNNKRVTDPITRKKYVWVEYFIKRIAEEQKTSGIKLLDVLDFHFYPGTENDSNTTLQLHRVWFDTTYVYPGANGVKQLGTNGWDNTIKKEYIMHRSAKWLNQYMGLNHGVSFGVSEMGTFYNKNPNVAAVCYASQLGTFSSQNVDLFTPWDWYKGMWEVLHLYSRYAQELSVQSLSDKDSLVSAYTSVDAANDSMTVILVNRDSKKTYNSNINLSSFNVNDGFYTSFQLSNLPKTETFISHTQNALVENTISVSSNKFSLNLPPYSVTAVRLVSTNVIADLENSHVPNVDFSLKIVPNPISQTGAVSFTLQEDGEIDLSVFDTLGRKLNVLTSGNLSKGFHSFPFETSELAEGVYYCVLKSRNKQTTQRVVVAK